MSKNDVLSYDLDNITNSIKEPHSIENLLSLEDFTEYYAVADKIRKKYVGDVVHIRAIIEFSNYCKRQCKYCGLNCKNTDIERYRMTPKEIIDTAYQAIKCGYKTLVMQSGEDKYFDKYILGDIVKEIKKCGVNLTLSCGEMDYDSYAYLKECGADRYLLKHETAQEDIYEFLHPCGTIEKRIECLKNLKKLGYEVGSGFMIGLPMQTFAIIEKDILLLKELNCDMAGIGPFIPHPNTVLKNYKHGCTELTKRAVALTRILIPSINLPATTALGVIDDREEYDVFSCGANVIMQKITPTKYKSLYEIYPSIFSETNIELQRENIEKQIINLNRIPV